ncbi:MAG TPA: NrtA/SsuA/CpmA family ABC transporter substrate-binding protein [Verrucomicrobiae bacterium]|nr:NrtA/SsuA/CpmA family ABC transporter substrate-binding protein [Verrucomicrobiae bacterium]
MMGNFHGRIRTLALAALLALCGCSDGKPETTRIVLSDVRVPGSLPVYVALEKGIFRRHGLEVTLASHGTGKETIEEVASGRAQAATAADVPVALAILDGKKFTVVTAIATTDTSNAIVIRRDRVRGDDLRGKRVGFTPGTTADYFLDTFLLLRRLPREAVIRVPLKADEQVAALRDGKIDALSTWHPYILQAAAAVADGVEVRTERDFVDTVYCLVLDTNFVEKNPGAVRRLVQALRQAVAYTRGNSGPSAEILSRYIPIPDPAAMKGYHYDVTLEQSLLINMSNEYAWAKRAGYYTGPSPDFTRYLHSRTLESIDPDLVSVIR